MDVGDGGGVEGLVCEQGDELAGEDDGRGGDPGGGVGEAAAIGGDDGSGGIAEDAVEDVAGFIPTGGGEDGVDGADGIAGEDVAGAGPVRGGMFGDGELRGIDAEESE